VYTWNDKLGSAQSAFIQGRSAFYFGFAHERQTIMARAAKMNIKLISIPQLNESAPINTANYWVESVVKKSRNPNEAWDFVRFMASESNVKEYTTATTQPSPYRSQIGTQAEDPAYEPFVAQILNATNWYHGKNIDAARTAFNDLITGYLAPYGEDEKPVVRDVNLLNRAASVVQQTM
jgi:ABC-type glycerol-3-phosphate transport system substrate-binding protein